MQGEDRKPSKRLSQWLRIKVDAQPGWTDEEREWLEELALMLPSEVLSAFHQSAVGWPRMKLACAWHRLTEGGGVTRSRFTDPARSGPSFVATWSPFVAALDEAFADVPGGVAEVIQGKQ